MEIITNYQMLLIKCLKEEIKAFLSNPETKEQKTFKKMAKNWLFNDNYHLDNEFSCVRICKTLNKDINALRMNILFAEKKGWTLDDFMKFSRTGKDPKEKKDGKSKQRKIKTSNSKSKRKSKSNRKI